MNSTKYLLHLLISVIILLLTSSFVLADTEISTTAVVNMINSDGIAKYEVSITNNANEDQTYTIYSLTSGSEWSVDPTPLSDRVIEDIAPGETYITTVQAWALDDFDPGIYYVYLQVDSDLGESYDIPLKIYLASDQETTYLPSIVAEVDMERDMDPREPQSIIVHVENRNQLNLSGLLIGLQSEISELNAVREIDLMPDESKTLEFTFELDPYQQPKDYYLFVVFELDGETIKVLEEKFEVVSLATPFSYELEEESVFLKKFQTFIIENDGNSENTQEFKYPINGFQALFLKSDGNVIKEDGQNYLAWELELEPGESTYVTATYNYRILLYLAIFFVLFLIFYLFVSSPIAVRKGAVTSEGTEGALHEIKIALELRNKGKKTIKDVTITDIIPGIANLEKSLDLGTLKPQQVLNTKQGTKIVWHLAELEGKEHRIVTYKIRTKLNVLGTFKLPRAIVEYNKKRGKVRKAYSNIFRLDAGKVEQV